MSKYNCRKCHLRQHCITKSKNAPSVKLMVQEAFEAKTDTLATWNLLQKNCLLLAAEKKHSKAALSDRLRQIKVAKVEALEAQAEQKPVQSSKSVIRPLSGTDQTKVTRPQKPSKKSKRKPNYLKPAPPPSKKGLLSPLKKLLPKSEPMPKGPPIYWLTVDSSQRHIFLADRGPLSLGRFDPRVGIPPDIDLSYEDRKFQLIARRHAAIVGHETGHVIEDLGSKVGVFLNGQRVLNGPSAPLKVGDCITMGQIQLTYSQIPAEILKSFKTGWSKHKLIITSTGRKISITPPRDLIIGRSDTKVNFKPDIDLTSTGHYAQLVSRRHIRIKWQNGRPYIEDLGSGFGTRLRGKVLPLGESVPLKPGDHIWLAGCVLAYDIDL